MRPRPWHREHKSYGPQAKLDPERVRRLKDLYDTGTHSQRALAKMFGLHQSNISRALNDQHYQPFEKES
jgi:DNA-binding MarR family transcriptional regulator